jgi:hypothetical protein
MRPAAVRWSAYTAVLYASFAHNLFWVPDGTLGYGPGFRVGYVGYDSELVLNRLKAAADGTAWWHPLVIAPDGRPAWYQSQFGLQGVVLGGVFRACGGSVSAFGAVAAGGTALATAALLGLFFADLARRVSPAAGDAGAGLTACTPVLLPFATSLYWVPPLLFGPFVAAWLLLPWSFGSGRRFALVAAAVGGLALLKGLCGYEYLSTVVLAPAAAVVYHRRAAGLSWRSVVAPAAGLVAAGVIGAAVAMGLHAVQLGALDGGGGFDRIRERAATMTGAGAIDPARFSLCVAPDPTSLPAPVRVHARHVLNAFWLPAAGTPTTWGPARAAAPLGVVVLAALAAGVWAWRRAPREVAALAPAAVVGLAGGLSWHVLAPTHTCLHAQFNLITYCVPFLPLAYALVGTAVAARFRRVGREWAYRVLAVGVVAVVAGNVMATANRADGAGAARAADRVAAVLREGRPVPIVRTNLSEYRLGFRPADLASAPWGNCRAVFDLEDRDGPTRVVTGWLVRPAAKAGGPVGRVVAVQGGRVIPAAVAYERVTVVEHQLGGAMTCTLFRVALPDDPADPAQLFSADPDGTVARLTGLAVPPAAAPAAPPAGP